MKIKLISKCLLVSVAASMGAIGFTQQQKADATQEAYATLASYPQVRYFPSVIESHRKWVATPEGKAILKATWFPSGDTGTQMLCDVDQEGRVISYRDIVNFSARHHQVSLLPPQLLRTKLQALPGNAAKPELINLLVLSFSMGESRVTRVYDRAKLPPEVQAVFQMMRWKLTPPEAYILPKEGDDLQVQARTLLGAGDLPEAEQVCREAITFLRAQLMTDTSARQLLGDIQLAQGKYGEALATYTTLHTTLGQHAIDPRLSLCIALYHVRLGALEKARQALLTCPDAGLKQFAANPLPEKLKDMPGTSDLKSMETTLMLMLATITPYGDTQKLKYLLVAEKLTPKNWLIADRIGELLHDMKRYDEAVTYYRRAMQLGDKVSYGHRLRVEMYDGWQQKQKTLQQNKPEAETSSIGQYEVDSQWENANGTKTFRVIELQPGGRYTEQIYWGIPWVGENPNGTFLSGTLTYTIHPDDTFTEQRIGTYVVTDNNIDLTQDSGPNSDPRFDVKSCRVTRNGLVIVRQFSFRQREDVDNGRLLHDSGVIEQLFMKIR